MPFKNKIFLANLVFLVMMLHCGCDRYWDDHYKSLSETSEKEKLISEMEKIPQISRFTEAVKQIDSLSDLLVQNRLYTVFAPVNEAFENIDPAVLNNDILRNRMLMYHFIDGKFKYKDLSSDNKMTFSNKYLNISFDGSSSKVLLDRKSSIIDPDYLALNGMIQVIDLPLIPLNNLYEYFIFNTHVNDFARAIQSYTKREFNLAASRPVGKNEEDKLVYDSVFIITNPFLYSGRDLIWEPFYNTTFRYINITDEDLGYTFLAPTNFTDAISQVLQSPVLNNPIAMKDLAGPVLADLIMSSRYTKDEVLSEIARVHSLPNADSSKVQLYLADLLRNNYAGAVPLSNGIVHEADGFEYHLEWLITNQGNLKKGQTERNYRDMLISNMTYSEGVDTFTVSSNNIQIIFYNSDTDLEGYSLKYGEWVNFEIKGNFYPVDYRVMVRGRNSSSGTFKVETEGQEISEFNFAEAPSGDLDTQFDELGTVTFLETKSSTNLKFTFINTHPEENTNQQYLWIREIKLVPILE